MPRIIIGFVECAMPITFSICGCWSVLDGWRGVYLYLKKHQSKNVEDEEGDNSNQCTVHFAKESVTDLSKKAERSGWAHYIIIPPSHQK